MMIKPKLFPHAIRYGWDLSYCYNYKPTAGDSHANLGFFWTFSFIQQLFNDFQVIMQLTAKAMLKAIYILSSRSVTTVSWRFDKLNSFCFPLRIWLVFCLSDYFQIAAYCRRPYVYALWRALQPWTYALHKMFLTLALFSIYTRLIKCPIVICVFLINALAKHIETGSAGKEIC